jgi:mono/diheme cytochrome c family protein
MKKIIPMFLCAALALSCGEKKEEKKDGFEMSRTKKEAPAGETASQGIPVDLSNKGIGPVKSVSFPDQIDPELAKQGEAKYKMLCTACHMAGQRFIGPDLTGVFERRSPEWVMNMILNPDEMIRQDPIAKALLQEYNNAMMTNQNLSEEEARAIAEYLRTL